MSKEASLRSRHPSPANLLREAVPYFLSAHRNKVCVILIDESIDRGSRLNRLLADLILIKQVTGMHLFLAFDVLTKPWQSLRSTTAKRFALIQDRAIEFLARIRSIVTDINPDIQTHSIAPSKAKQRGVVNGVDWGYLGEDPVFDFPMISTAMGEPSPSSPIILIKPLGYAHDRLWNPIGEGHYYRPAKPHVENEALLHVPGQGQALALAVALRADKMITLVRPKLKREIAFRSKSATAALAWQKTQVDLSPNAVALIETAATYVNRGIERFHIVGDNVDGGLMLELFSTEGVGAMISREAYHQFRPARKEDKTAIIQLLESLPREDLGSFTCFLPEDQRGNDAVRPRTEKEIEEMIDSFIVLAHDSLIIACASLQRFGPKNRKAEICCLAVHPDYQEQNYGNLLLQYCEKRAPEIGIERLIAVTTKVHKWFKRNGYAESSSSELPLQRRVTALKRRGQAFSKNLGTRD